MKSRIQRLRLRDHLETGSSFLVGSYVYAGNTRPVFHDHDFAEVFWVAEGTCRHHLASREELLVAGDLRFVRPEHIHAFTARGSERGLLINIAFPAGMLETWCRHYPILKERFFWATGKDPSGLRLDARGIASCNEQARLLAGRTHDLLFLHHFLLTLLVDLMPPAPDTRNLPHWLKKGLSALEHDETRIEGLPAFLRACGRSGEHVARCCRRWLDKTPVDLVNEARLQEASRLLRMTDEDILSILVACGFSSPAHFYKLFQKKYGMTPRQFRIQQHRVMSPQHVT